MTLYQEVPKTLIVYELKKRFTPEQLDTVQPELNELLYSCSTTEQLFEELTIKISHKTSTDKKVNINRYRF